MNRRIKQSSFDGNLLPVETASHDQFARAGRGGNIGNATLGTGERLHSDAVGTRTTYAASAVLDGPMYNAARSEPANGKPSTRCYVCTSAVPIWPADSANLRYNFIEVEAVDAEKLSKQPFTVALWHKWSPGGSGNCAVFASYGGNSVVKGFAVAENDWGGSSLVFPEFPEVTARSSNDTDLVLKIGICSTGGADHAATEGQWTAGDKFCLADTNNTAAQPFYFDNIILKAGIHPTLHLEGSGRTLAQGRQMAERRAYSSYGAGITVESRDGISFTATGAGNNDGVTVQLPVEMRVSPTVQILSSNGAASGMIRNETLGTDEACTITRLGNKTFTVRPTGGTTAGHIYSFHWKAWT